MQVLKFPPNNAAGPTYNQQQLAGLYTRILRDEILAEWRNGGRSSNSSSSGGGNGASPEAVAGDGSNCGPWPPGSSSSASASSSWGSSSSVSSSDLDSSSSDAVCDPCGLVLHIYCHVSGEEMWPAPPRLRSFIFQREMGLVLDTITHAGEHVRWAQAELRSLLAARHSCCARCSCSQRESLVLDESVRAGGRASGSGPADTAMLLGWK